MTTAERQHAQQVAALRLANQVRSDRAHLKAEIHEHDGDLAAQVLADPPAYAQRMKVLDLLLAVPKYGRVKASKLLAQCRVSPSWTLEELVDRQRRELGQRLRNNGRLR